MSCNEPIIEVQNLGKCYNIYKDPKDRLRQAIVPRIHSLFGRKQAHRYYQEFWALKDVSLTVGRGETVGIIGRNGSGKSTLLQMICGTLEPTEGSITTHGRIAALLELGAGFNPEFTGRENVYLNATLLGLTREEIKNKYDEIVGFADIGSFIDQPVKHYSSGMYARLAFAVAISVDPQILIVDEALAVGDEPFQRKCFARIEEIKSRGGSILLVSHAATTVVSLCDRAVLLHKGRRLFTGSSKVAVHWYKKLMNASDESYEEIREQLTLVESESLLTEKQILAPERIHQSEVTAREAAVTDLGGFDPDLESQSRLVYETNGAEISQIRIENLKGETVNELLQGSRYRVCYEVFFEDGQLSAYFRCMIKTVAGVEIGGASYPHSNSGGYVAEAGEKVSLAFEFSCHLNAGTYFINCGVSDGVRTLHRVLDALAFRVVSISDVLSIGTVDFLVDAASSAQTLQGVQSS